MGNKSSVDRLPQEVRSHIERRLRENRLTLDELINDLQKNFPSANSPSRSALGRYKQNFEQLPLSTPSHLMMQLPTGCMSAAA